ncbi:hypothetical protein C0Q70_15798 [Pomacea canaliculata]|uniref:Uncharacterized protein n=1 Tax=Pomacea canaliculata TaxID=400727 RepID=A0A2T7NVU3_POMCA|nr:hypothetical protein C0Q70_15798 [Pomacea canaliculata]
MFFVRGSHRTGFGHLTVDHFQFADNGLQEPVEIDSSVHTPSLLYNPTSQQETLRNLPSSLKPRGIYPKDYKRKKEERRDAHDDNDDESKVSLFPRTDVTSCVLHHEPGCKRHSWPRRVVIARAKRRRCGDEEVTSHGGGARGVEEDSDGAQSWRAVWVTKSSSDIEILCIRPADDSPHGDQLKELMSEIQGLRSQFQALQMRRELSALRSDMLQAKSLLADAGSRRDDLPGEDASKQGSDFAGRTVEAGVVQNIPSILSSGSVYERCGHGGCPNDTEMVYTGIIGGSSHDQTGAAANALCLPLEPVLVNNPGTPHVTLIVGAELEVTPLAQHDLDPLCAVCRTPRPTVVMVPAANACQLGWTLEYSGYLMAGHNTHPGASQFICIDKQQQTRMASDKNENGRLFYYSTGICGSLPCPPYQAGKVFPCVVCSK